MTMRDETVSLETNESEAARDARRAAAIDWAFRGLIVGLSVLWLVTLGVTAARGVDTASLARAVGLL
jgi:hypothetical protein